MADNPGTAQTVIPHEGALDFTRFKAALFDLDGVVTQTAAVHARAWKRLFDDYLRADSIRTGRPFLPFDLEDDYRRYVDGKPRYEGVKSFLDSRGIALPWGQPGDGPDEHTIYGLGNKKDAYFEAYLKETGVIVYPGTVRFLRVVRAQGMKTAVVSSSNHALDVVATASLTDLFDTRIDGHETQRLRLRGKPEPDTFLEAARRLNVDPRQAIVIEDALAGVEAGRNGGFGLVIGVNRRNQAEALRRHGADLVAADLAELLPDDRRT